MMSRVGRIRIIAGKFRNSRLDVATRPGLRPTSERVRETLFNWLMPMLPGARVLDLCAGTGALGIEALSRGASSVQFVEADAIQAQALRTNLARLQASGTVVTTADAGRYLCGTPQAFSLVFLDPPFTQALWTPLAERLEYAGWLTASAHIYMESPRGMAVPALPANWQLWRESHAGQVRFAVYRRAVNLRLE